MFSVNQVLGACAIGGIAVVLACLACRWQLFHALMAGLMAGSMVAVWRVGANIAELNADVVPHVSVGDVGCIAAGALAPLLMAFILDDTRRWWLPGLVGGLAAFLGNVVILW